MRPFFIYRRRLPSPLLFPLFVPARDGFKGTKTNVLCLTFLLIQAKKTNANWKEKIFTHGAHL